MQLENAKLDRAQGAILVHNQADAAGHRLLSKGRQLTAQDIAVLQQAGLTEVLVARLEAGDVRENEAALRLAVIAAGPNVTLTVAAGGRVNLLAGTRGLVIIEQACLTRLNSLQGVTLATRPGYSLTEEKKIVATVKTIGLALAGQMLDAAEALAAEFGHVVSVRAIPPGRVAIILTGSPQARARVESTFVRPIADRVTELGSAVMRSEYVGTDPSEIASAVERAAQDGATCIILAGETSIMDAGDVTPRGIVQAGSTIELYGAPVEPGNLLLLAYRGELPIIGAPGCVKSRETNVVDLILPRLLSREHVTRADIIALANGGLIL